MREIEEIKNDLRKLRPVLHRRLKAFQQDETKKKKFLMRGTMRLTWKLFDELEEAGGEWTD